MCDDCKRLRHGALILLSVYMANISGAVQAQARTEVHPVETVTLSNQQFLLGEKGSQPVILAGELRIPAGRTGRIPAVILVHGSAGITAGHQQWAQELNRIGVAAFLLDSFSGRGVTDTIANQAQVGNLNMMVDAYRALGTLARHPGIDASRIAVMGFSKGSIAAVYSSNIRFQNMYGPPGIQFAAHIGLYTVCNSTYRGDDQVSGKPIRLFHGTADDYVPVAPCRAYVERLKKKNADVSITEYPNAYHLYDDIGASDFGSFLPQAVTTRNCSIAEADGGILLNRATGKEFGQADQCVERGAHLGYDETAAKATIKAVMEFLVATFHLKQ